MKLLSEPIRSGANGFKPAPPPKPTEHGVVPFSVPHSASLEHVRVFQARAEADDLAGRLLLTLTREIMRSMWMGVFDMVWHQCSRSINATRRDLDAPYRGID